MIVLSAAALLLLAPVPYSSAKTPEAATVADYLSLCRADAKACSDYLFDFAWESSVGAQKVPYCLPETEPPETVTGKVTAWLSAHPELGGAPTKPSLTKALVATYPCGRR